MSVTFDDLPLTPQQIVQAGLKRISSLTDKYGITSPEVFSACERWGAILDDVNHPDGTCLHCGLPVRWDLSRDVGRYIHRGGNEWCGRVAAATAERKPDA